MISESIVPIRSTEQGYVFTKLPGVYIRPVSLHGSIGAGKTTILTKIERCGYRVVYEDIDSWRDVKGHNLLEEYYKDPSRLAYVFQSEIVRTRYKQFIDLINNEEWLKADGPDTVRFGDIKLKIVFTERDHLSSLMVFSKRLVDSGLMLPVEYAHMELWCEMLGLPISRFVIYLKVNPSECMTRIEARQRPEEASTVKMDLLDSIDKYYLEWLQRDFPMQVTYVDSFKLDMLDKQVQNIIKSVKR